MNDSVPSLVEQQRIEESLRVTLCSALKRITGSQPTWEQIEMYLTCAMKDFTSQQGISPETHTDQPPIGPPLPERRPFALTAEQLREAEAAFWIVKVNGIPSLTDALAWYAQHRHPSLHAPPLRQCVQEFIAIKRCEGVMSETVWNYHRHFRRFLAEFGNEIPISVTPIRLADFFLKIERISRRIGMWQALHAFYRWAVTTQYAVENPVPLALAKPTAVVGPRLIFKVGEVRSLLHRIRDTDEAWFWALALFSALRVEEIVKIHAHPDPWSIIDLKTGMIQVPESISKTCDRQIPIQPTLREWMRWIRDRGIPLPGVLSRDRYRIARTVLAKRANVDLEALKNPKGCDERFRNITRRTYLSYRLALPEASFADVALEAGNSEPILRKFYVRRVSRQDALRYFSLTPLRV